MGYIAPISQEDRLKQEAEALKAPVAEEVTATEEVAEEAPKKKSTKKSAE